MPYSISLKNFTNDPIGSIVDPLAGVDPNAKYKPIQRDYSVYDYDVGADPTARALLREGFGMSRGLREPYGGPAQTRLPGEGNPAQLAAGRRRRNDQYAAAGLPDVGFDPGLYGREMDSSALHRGMLDDRTQGLAMKGFYGTPGHSPPRKEELNTSLGQSPVRGQALAAGIPDEQRQGFKPPQIEKERR